MKRLVLLFAVIVSLSLAVVAQEMKHDQMEHSVQKAAMVKGWISDGDVAESAKTIRVAKVEMLK